MSQISTSVLVIEPDPRSRFLLRHVLTRLGATRVRCLATPPPAGERSERDVLVVSDQVPGWQGLTEEHPGPTLLLARDAASRPHSLRVRLLRLPVSVKRARERLRALLGACERMAAPAA